MLLAKAPLAAEPRRSRSWPRQPGSVAQRSAEGCTTPATLFRGISPLAFRNRAFIFVRVRADGISEKQIVTTLEELIKKERVARSLPMELNPALEKGLAHGFRVQTAWCEISVSYIKRIIVNVRSRLLDFLSELKENAGNPANDAELNERATSFDTARLFNSAIFGDHTTIVIGEKNVQTVSYTVTTEQLVENVRKFVADVHKALPTSGLSNSMQ